MAVFDMAGFGIKWSQQQRARHADEDVDWSQAKWIPFTNSVAIDLGPGEGQRLVWLMGMWTKTNGYSRSGSGTHVRVGHTPSGIPNQSHRAPQITIQWPRDGQQLSRKDLVMASGFVDDPDAHVTCVTATAEGTNRVDASVARNGFFSFRDVRLQSGTNRLTFIATNDGGKASETNLVVYQKP